MRKPIGRMLAALPAILLAACHFVSDDILIGKEMSSTPLPDRFLLQTVDADGKVSSKYRGERRDWYYTFRDVEETDQNAPDQERSGKPGFDFAFFKVDDRLYLLSSLKKHAEGREAPGKKPHLVYMTFAVLIEKDSLKTVNVFDEFIENWDKISKENKNVIENIFNVSVIERAQSSQDNSNIKIHQLDDAAEIAKMFAYHEKEVQNIFEIDNLYNGEFIIKPLR